MGTRAASRLWTAILLLLPAWSFAANDLVFSGNLVRVGPESISVRLADHRVIDALLPNNSPSGGQTYNMGDQVQITCKPIHRVWEEDTTRYQFLEVTKVRILSPARDSHRTAPAPTKRGTDAYAMADDRLERAREVNLKYAANLPNFVADETAKRYTSTAKAPKWRYQDTIATEIAITGGNAVRREIHKDGKAWDRPFQALPGFKWYGGFGTELKPLFDAQCPSTLEYAGRSEERGKPLVKYRFSSPEDGCLGPFYEEYQRYNPARTGHVLISEPGGHVMQYDEDVTGFPTDFGFTERTEQVWWDYVKIGEASRLLPVSAIFEIFYSSGIRWRVEVEYKNHRHFESSSNITF